MAVVTNKPVRVSRHILDGLGLGGYFSLVLGGDSTARKKPHPDPVLQALAHLHVSQPAAAVMIGDSANDIFAGRSAGLMTCGVPSNIGDAVQLRQSFPDFLVLNTLELTRLFN